MQLSIIIINYKTPQITLACLQSVHEFLGARIEYEIFVVDNGSGDDSAGFLQQNCRAMPGTTLIPLDKNIGFGAANNVAVGRCTGEYILFLNSDTLLLDSSIVASVDHLKGNIRVGGLGCLLLNGDRSRGISYGRFPTIGIFIREILTRQDTKLRGLIPKPDEGLHDIDFPCGAFFLIRKSVLDLVGLFDESFFMYYEEADLAMRIWSAGFSIEYFPETRIIHLGGRSTSASAIEKQVTWSLVGLRRFYVKHNGLVRWNLLRCILFLDNGALFLRRKVLRKSIPMSLGMTVRFLLKDGFHGGEE
jgi:GT2 family glycosyltransferase